MKTILANLHDILKHQNNFPRNVACILLEFTIVASIYVPL